MHSNKFLSNTALLFPGSYYAYNFAQQKIVYSQNKQDKLLTRSTYIAFFRELNITWK